MKTVYVIGDSHAASMRKACKEYRAHKETNIDIQFRPFGAVKQGINPHHQRQDRSIQLLEENWKEKLLPFDRSDLHSPKVSYALHLPFNGLPMLRPFEFDRFSVDPCDKKRDFLSRSVLEALVIRRNRLGVGLVKDMVEIGLHTYVFEAPRPFENYNYTGRKLDTFKELVATFWEKTRVDLEQVGATVIEQPAETRVISGFFTRKAFSCGDGQHGTETFYRLQYDKFLEKIYSPLA